MKKREFESEFNMMTSNGDSFGLDSDAKRARMEPNGPSRVLHIRNLPLDATEFEIVQLGIPFGRMTNLVYAKKKYQALLEMADLASAQSMVNYYNDRAARIRGNNLFIQFSNHQQLKVQEHSHINAGARAALDAADRMVSQHSLVQSAGFSNPPPNTGFNNPPPNTGFSNQTPNTGFNNPAANTGFSNATLNAGFGNSMPSNSGGSIIKIEIDNMMYPINVDILHKVFSKCGQIMKILILNKSNPFEGYVQFCDITSALNAKQMLDGKNIYNGCCSLRLQETGLMDLSVKYNNDQSFDYSNPTLPRTDEQAGILGVPPIDVERNLTGLLSSLTGAANSLASFAPPGLPHSASMQHSLPFNMGFNKDMCPSRHDMSGGPMLSSHNMSRLSDGPPMGGQQRFGGPPPPDFEGRGGQGCVLIVSNLDEQNVTPDSLFTLFGCYGPVLKVKIMYNKKDTALVEYSNPMIAQNAMEQLDKANWAGKTIRVAISKHSHVQMPKSDAQDAWLTKDYSGSNLSRFRNPQQKHYRNTLYPPGPVLHLSNIAEGVSEHELRQLFNEHGTVVAFKFFSNDAKMALIELSSQEEAIGALVALHNYELSDRKHLRVSFTKSHIEG